VLGAFPKSAFSFDERREGGEDGDGEFVAGLLVFIQFQLVEGDGFEIKLDGLVFQLLEVVAELAEIGIRGAEAARAAGMMVDERVLGSVKIGDGRVQSPLGAGEQPAGGMGEAITPEDGHGFALDDLREVLAVEMGDGFGHHQDLLIRKYHGRGLV
jgi:hypothetical protein